MSAGDERLARFRSRSVRDAPEARRQHREHDAEDGDHTRLWRAFRKMETRLTRIEAQIGIVLVIAVGILVKLLAG